MSIVIHNYETLPPMVQQDLTERSEKYLEFMGKLQKASTHGPWTLEMDVLDLAKCERYRPGLVPSVTYEFVRSIPEKVEINITNLQRVSSQRFKSATTNKKMIIRYNPSITSDDYCEVEYKNGDMVFHIRDFMNIGSWGNDFVEKLEKTDALAAVKNDGQGITPQYGETLLSQLIDSSEKPEAARLIIQFGAVDKDLNQSGYGYPLHHIIWNIHMDLAKILIEEGGADPNILNADKRTPLVHMCAQPRESNSSLRREEQEGKKFTAMVKYFMANPHVDPNIPDKHGKTAFMYAVMTWDWREVVELFMNDPRTDLFYQNSKGETALSLAGHQWIKDALIKRQQQPRKPLQKPVPFVKKQVAKPVNERSAAFTKTAGLAPSASVAPSAATKVFGLNLTAQPATPAAPKTVTTTPAAPKTTIATTPAAPKTTFNMTPTAPKTTFTSTPAAPKTTFGVTTATKTMPSKWSTTSTGTYRVPNPPPTPLTSTLADTSNTYNTPPPPPPPAPPGSSKTPTVNTSIGNTSVSPRVSTNIPPPPPPMPTTNVGSAGSINSVPLPPPMPTANNFIPPPPPAPMTTSKISTAATTTPVNTVATNVPLPPPPPAMKLTAEQKLAEVRKIWEQVELLDKTDPSTLTTVSAWQRFQTTRSQKMNELSQRLKNLL